jgi:NADPH:quinone reductase
MLGLQGKPLDQYGVESGEVRRRHRSRLLNDYAPETHGAILDQVAAFVAEGQIRPIVTTRLDGLTPETMKKAHELVETRRTIGKLVIALER